MRALAGQHAELDGLLAGLGDADWQRPSRCPGWSVADVVLHLAQTDELALASGEGRDADLARFADRDSDVDVDEVAAQAVERERGASNQQVHERWRASAAAVRAMLAGCDPRLDPRAASLIAEGADGEAVLDLLRTYA